MSTQARDDDVRLSISVRAVADADPRFLEIEFTFVNATDRALKIPLMDGSTSNLEFLDFVFVGNRGGLRTISNEDSWVDPVAKPVRLVTLAPRKPHRIRERIGLSHLDEVQAWRVFCIYRDHGYGHADTYPEFGKDARDVWKGATISNLISIKLPR